MVFSSTLFIFIFLPITLAVYYLLRDKYRNYWLLFMSLIFFGWSQPNYLWIILANIGINYLCAIFLDRFQVLRKPIVTFSVFANLCILFYFKYFDFAIESINNIFKSSLEIYNIILPIGISFFTFQGMSYVIDVYRGNVGVQKNPVKVALYITLFPQLIAGPIVRYTDIVNDIDSRSASLDDFSEGLERFLIGLAKKVLIANTLAAMVDSVWNNGPDCNGWSVAWVASIAYTLQIYFDFSGYSDMAIGLGRLFGFHFCENFDLPYVSNNISEFWRRWHISLSTWFRDYVYIPLGGNRKNVYINLVIVFLLTGIWHGAAWHYVVWGIWNGLFVLVERCFKQKQLQIFSERNITIVLLDKVYTLCVVNFGWVLFRAPNMMDAIAFIRSMFGFADCDRVGFTLGWYLDKWTLLMLILGVLFSTTIPRKVASFISKKINVYIFIISKYASLVVLFYFSIMRIVSGTYNPFIYFQF